MWKTLTDPRWWIGFAGTILFVELLPISNEWKNLCAFGISFCWTAYCDFTREEKPRNDPHIHI